MYKFQVFSKRELEVLLVKISFISFCSDEMTKRDCLIFHLGHGRLK